MKGPFENVTQCIGNTPLVKLQRLTGNTNVSVFVKLEYFNPLASVKDRIAISMVEDAEKKGRLGPGSVIVEPTSGNTGIALAYIGAVKGYRVILTMPDSLSMERRKLLAALGAELVLTPGKEGMKRAITRAEEISAEENGLILNQFENPANPAAHLRTTGPEIWNALDGNIDIFAAGVGTGGTISGVSEFLKGKKKDVRSVAVEPVESAVLSGRSPGSHKIQGIGAGFIPKNVNTEIIDEILTVKSEDAGDTARAAATQEGIFTGISGGANIHAALELAGRKENEGKTIVTVACDTGERYLSTWLYNTGAAE